MPADWWNQALLLESQDKLDEAERLVRESLPDYAPFPEQLAELYRLRCRRLLDAGRFDDARIARAEAIQWIDFNTACATSGGEAAARLYTARNFKASLPDVPPA